MSRCDLRVEVDGIKTQAGSLLEFSGGETLRGRVHVTVNENVRCRGLTIKSLWRTHGRGNVAEAVQDEVTVFNGEWLAGETASYDFQITLGDWPPSYHGHHLNVDHYVEAVADIPWAFDPKARQQVIVRPRSITNEQIEDSTKTTSSSVGKGCVIAFLSAWLLIALLTGAIFFFAAFFGIFLGIPFGIYYFIRHVLPKWRLGEVEFNLKKTDLSPGETLSGTLTLSPSKQLEVFGIESSLIAEEHCVHGSGSNRTSYRHEVFSELLELKPHTTLPAGKTVIPVSIPISDQAPFSIELPDNQLNWKLKSRIVLARWPDWKQETEIKVLPLASTFPSTDPEPRSTPTLAPPPRQVRDELTSATRHAIQTNQESPSAGISFSETIELIAAAGNDNDQIETILDATRGIGMPGSIQPDRRLLYAGDESQFLRRGEEAWWAFSADTKTPTRMTVFVDRVEAKAWQDRADGVHAGIITLIGYDTKDDRVRARWTQSH